MIRRLRNKIALINLILASIILLTALISVFITGYSRIESEGKARMKMAIDASRSMDKEEFFYEKNFADTMVFVVYPNGEVDIFCHEQNQQLVSNAGDYLVDIINSQQDYGFLLKARCRYLCEREADTGIIRVAMQDTFGRQNSIGEYIVLYIVTIVISLICFFFISYLLANIALKPVEDSWKQQKQFVADASHELKTPLSVIMANTEIIASHPDETVASQMKWIENTRSESKRMAELVANLLFLAKHDDGLVVQTSHINLSDCIDKVALSYDAVFYENNKKFSYEIEKDIETNGNEQQLQQLITILLDNANKYSVDEGNINLTLTANGKHAVLTVSNDSITLTQEQTDHLFDRFYTIDQSRNKNSGGNGLGLSIAKMICETHKGKISVESKNNRTTFTATIPLIKKQK